MRTIWLPCCYWSKTSIIAGPGHNERNLPMCKIYSCDAGCENYWMWILRCIDCFSVRRFIIRPKQGNGIRTWCGFPWGLQDEIVAPKTGKKGYIVVMYRAETKISGWKSVAYFWIVEHSGLEPLTSTLPVLRSTRWANAPICGCKGNTIFWTDKFLRQKNAIFWKIHATTRLMWCGKVLKRPAVATFCHVPNIFFMSAALILENNCNFAKKMETCPLWS